MNERRPLATEDHAEAREVLWRHVKRLENITRGTYPWTPDEARRLASAIRIVLAEEPRA